MFNTQLFVIWQTASIISNTTSTEDANPTVLSSTTDKINRISNPFWDRRRHKYVVNLRETQQTSKLNIVLSDFRLETKGFWFESGCQLCTKVSALKQ